MLGNHYLITFGGVSFESHSVAQPSLGLLMQPKLILDSQILLPHLLEFWYHGHEPPCSHRNQFFTCPSHQYLLNVPPDLTPIGIS